jgi:threonine dehydrogenase-like Zn-dependent dehydrogenase
MLPGDIMGHETMGEAVETGKGLNGTLKNGDRIVVPFTIICGQCDQCRRALPTPLQILAAQLAIAIE